MHFRSEGKKPVRPEGEWLERLEHVLSGAAKRRMIADLPVGVLLSGGLDSSLLVALVAFAEQADAEVLLVAPNIEGLIVNRFARCIKYCDHSRNNVADVDDGTPRRAVALYVNPARGERRRY